MNVRTAVTLGAILGFTLTQMKPASAVAGHCEIAIVNTMHDDVIVHGTFDDGHPLAVFRIHSGDAPHYVSLYYSGYCHSGMHLTVEDIHPSHHRIIYNAWTRTGSTVRTVPH